MTRIQTTVKLLTWYRAFIRSNCERAKIPGELFGETMTKEEAQRKLTFLVDVAVNRRAGIPDKQGRKQEYEHQIGLRRDKYRLQDIARRIRVYQFETKEVAKRFGHKLASYDD